MKVNSIKSQESQWISRNIFLSEGNSNPFNTSLLITAGQAVQTPEQLRKIELRSFSVRSVFRLNLHTVTESSPKLCT